MKDLSDDRHAVEGGDRVRARRRDHGDRGGGAGSPAPDRRRASPATSRSHVRFGYTDDGTVLKDVDLTIEAGQRGRSSD